MPGQRSLLALLQRPRAHPTCASRQNRCKRKMEQDECQTSLRDAPKQCNLQCSRSCRSLHTTVRTAGRISGSGQLGRARVAHRKVPMARQRSRGPTPDRDATDRAARKGLTRVVAPEGTGRGIDQVRKIFLLALAPKQRTRSSMSASRSTARLAFRPLPNMAKRNTAVSATQAWGSRTLHSAANQRKPSSAAVARTKQSWAH